jgi:alpha-tubulin suppressor-like RCC1 family protein
LYLWGKNDSGKCGKSKKETEVSAAYKFSLKELGFSDESDTFADVSCGYGTTLVCTLDTGRVYSFGTLVY